MTRQQLKDAFGKLYIESDISSYDRIVTTEKSFIEVDLFLDMFGEAELNYQSLYNATTEKSGWRKRFSEWKDKGIIE